MAPVNKLLRSPLSMCFGFICGFGVAYILFTGNVKYEPTTLQYLSFFTENRFVPAPAPSELHHFHKTLQGKGVILKVKGGIGNQLYQYACMYGLARDLNRPLYLYVPTDKLSSNRKFLPSHREFALDKFQIPQDNLIDSSTVINKSSVVMVNDSQLLFRTYSTDSPFLQLDEDSFCPSYAFWFQYKNDILSMLQLRSEVIRRFPKDVIKLAKEIDNTEESVAVHVRKGDFAKIEWTLPISYQKQSIANISKMFAKRRKGKRSPPPKFFIFSDDIEYCRKEFKKLAKAHKLVFVSSSSTSTSLQDFYLMKKCKHFVVSNSTFSRWIAYLATQGNRTHHDGTSSSIVIASEYKPGFYNGEAKDRLKFYKNVLFPYAVFPKEWIIYYPSEN